MSTFSPSDGKIDGPTPLLMNEIVAGKLQSFGVAWDSRLDAPNLTSTATATFNISSQLEVGSTIAIQLPCDGWSMPPQPLSDSP